MNTTRTSHIEPRRKGYLMSANTRRHAVKCAEPTCAHLTRSDSGRCLTHQPAPTVVSTAMGISVLGRILTPEQAYNLAHRLADVLEKHRERVA